MKFEYKDNPIEVKLYRGTGVHEIVVNVSNKHLDGKEIKTKEWSRFEGEDKGGKHVKMGAGVRHDIRKEKDQVVVRCVMDTRVMSPSRYEIAPFNGIDDLVILKIDLDEPSLDNAVKCLLAVDLGNTRSYALICDDIMQSHTNANWIHPLPLKDYYEWHDSEAGVFDSVFSLAKSEMGKDGEGEPLSFLRLGKAAIRARRFLASDQLPGDFTLSSPKRYFWDKDSHEGGWKCLDVIKKNAVPLGGRMAKWFAQKMGCPERKLPRAAMMSVMAMELLEQAELFINGKLARDGRYRIIDKVVFTYPAAWSDCDAELYKNCIQMGIDAFCSSGGRSLPMPSLDVSCDEATAVLLNYVYGEIRKYGSAGDNWIRAAGRSIPRELPVVRVAVVDIGGGTTDLVIADVEDTDNGGNSVKLSINRLYQDGLNRAGDLLLLSISKEIIAPKLAGLLYPGTITGNEKFRASFLDDISNWVSEDASIKYLSRFLWFPLAVKVLGGITEAGAHKKIKLDGDERFAFEQLCKKAKVKYPDFPFLPDNEAAISLDERDHEIFDNLVKRIFYPIAENFGAAISGFDCDIVLLAGKTSEVPGVRRAFENFIALPPEKVVSLTGYMVGKWCPLSNGNGRIDDPKVTTVLGAAIYGLNNLNSPILGDNVKISTRIAPGIDDANANWGIVTVNNPNFKIKHSILTKSNDRAEISFSGKPMLIARKRFDFESCAPEIRYELRMNKHKTGARRLGDNTLIITLKRSNTHDGKAFLSIEEVKGTFSDGTPVAMAHLELRPRLFAEEDFWLDSGVLK